MKNSKVALGFTDTVDYELDWDSVNLNSLIQQLGISSDDIKYYSSVSSLKDLISFMIYFMQKNEGCGLFIDNGAPVFELLKKCEYTVSLGGTAVRASSVLTDAGIECNLSLSSINDIVKKKLSPLCRTWCALDYDYDAPHIVLQYPCGEEIHGAGFCFTTSRANRLIFTCDTSNSNLTVHQGFLDSLVGCDVFVISSFELIEDEKLLLSILSAVDNALDEYNGIVFYEDACFKIRKHALIVNDMLSKHTHIHSMNEDEFAFYLGQKADLLDSSYMENALHAVYEKIKSHILLLHTSKYCILYGNGCDELKNALESGVLYSSARFGYGDNVTNNIIEEIRNSGKYDAEGICFTAEIEKKCRCICIPSYDVHTEKPTTIGLGDTFVGGFVLGLIENMKS